MTTESGQYKTELIAPGLAFRVGFTGYRILPAAANTNAPTDLLERTFSFIRETVSSIAQQPELQGVRQHAKTISPRSAQ